MAARRPSMLISAGVASAAVLVAGGTVMVRGDGYPAGDPGPATSTEGRETPTATPSPRGAPGSKVRRAAGRPQPVRVKVPFSAKGRYSVVKGRTQPPAGHRGKVIRYRVRVERGLPFEPARFAAEVDRILHDRRGWGRGRTWFKRVESGPVRFHISLTSPALTDQECLPFITGGELSCTKYERLVYVNARRWARGAKTYGRDLASYREYLINHEVGHVLDRRDAPCPKRGRRAPVMVQQTKSLQGCRRNPWPFP